MIRRLLNIPRAIVEEARSIRGLPALAAEQFHKDSPFWEEFEEMASKWGQQ